MKCHTKPKLDFVWLQMFCRLMDLTKFDILIMLNILIFAFRLDRGNATILSYKGFFDTVLQICMSLPGLF